MSLSQFAKSSPVEKSFINKSYTESHENPTKCLDTIRQKDRRPEERMFSPHNTFFPGGKEWLKPNQIYISTHSTLLLFQKFRKGGI
jgi:hypothetical protein